MPIAYVGMGQGICDTEPCAVSGAVLRARAREHRKAWNLPAETLAIALVAMELICEREHLPPGRTITCL